MAGTTANGQTRPQDLQCLIREATLILQEPLETMASPLRTFRKRIQVQHKVDTRVFCGSSFSSLGLIGTSSFFFTFLSR